MFCSFRGLQNIQLCASDTVPMMVYHTCFFSQLQMSAQQKPKQHPKTMHPSSSPIIYVHSTLNFSFSTLANLYLLKVPEKKHPALSDRLQLHPALMEWQHQQLVQSSQSCHSYVLHVIFRPIDCFFDRRHPQETSVGLANKQNNRNGWSTRWKKHILYINIYTFTCMTKVAAKHFPEHDSETSESPLINFEGKNPCQVAQGHNQQHLLAAAVALLSWSMRKSEIFKLFIPSSEKSVFYLSSKNHLAKMNRKSMDIEGPALNFRAIWDEGYS